MAAAIVIGEIGLKTAAAYEGLAALLASGEPILQRRALEALSKIGPKKLAAEVLELAGARDVHVREAAVQALGAIGPSVLGRVEERLERAEGEERRALGAVLARLGGRQALAATLSRLITSDEEAARLLALEVRQQHKDAGEKTRRAALVELKRFLGTKAAQKAPLATATAVKMIGHLELPGTAGLLLAAARRGDERVREEALAALRVVPLSAAEQKSAAKVLVDIAQRESPALARAALFTLANLTLTPALLQKVGKLATHEDAERATLVIEYLGRQSGAAVAAVLVAALRQADRARAERIAAALRGKREAATALFGLLAAGHEPALVVRLLREVSRDLGDKQRAALVKLALARASAGSRDFEAVLTLAHELSAERTTAEIHAAVKGLLAKKKREHAIALLVAICRTPAASDDLRFRLATLELARPHYDTHAPSREADSALRALTELARRGFDVVAGLQQERLPLEALYYVGFHLAELDHPFGEDLLTLVAERGGRKKLGTMAKNKLELWRRG